MSETSKDGPELTAKRKNVHWDYRPPSWIRFFLNPVIEVLEEANEKEIRISVVVENFRAMFFWCLLLVLGTGMVLTKVFVETDHTAIIMDVFGGTNLCTYLDFPPATYILPFLWLFPMMYGITYCTVSMFRIGIAFEEQKITGVAKVLLCITHIYCILSLMAFTICFAVSPDRQDPTTMIVHTIPYINLKNALAVLQIAVVWFGQRVAWNKEGGIKELWPSWWPGWFPAWKTLFITISWCHAAILLLVQTISNIMIINGLGDMGAQNLDGQGVWWDVRGPNYKVVWDIFTNVGSGVLGILFPLIQAQYLAYLGTKNISETHAVTFSVTDNRKAKQ